MTTHVIVLNGGSSSGKNTLAAELQRLLPEPWLSLSVDTFCDALPARAGARVVVDDVFLGGPSSQQRWRTALEGLGVLWVGVRCAPEGATRRERARGDRQGGTPGEGVVESGTRS